MHTSFEDLRDQRNKTWDDFRARQGEIYRMGEDGKPMWERPRTWHEAGYRRTVTTFALGVLTALPLALALMLYLIKT